MARVSGEIKKADERQRHVNESLVWLGWHVAVLVLWLSLFADFEPLVGLSIIPSQYFSLVLIVGPAMLLYFMLTGAKPVPYTYLVAIFLLVFGYVLALFRYDSIIEFQSVRITIKLLLNATLGLTVYFLALRAGRIPFLYMSLVFMFAVQTIYSLLQYLDRNPGDPPFLTFYTGWSGSNVTGLYLAVLSVVTAMLAMSSNISKPGRILLLGISGLFILALLLTLARGALLALILAVSVYFLLSKRNRMAFLSFIVLIGISLWYLLLLLGINHPLQSAISAEAFDISVPETNRSNAVRVGLAIVGFRMVLDNPIQGVGPGNFDSNVHRFIGEDDPWYVQIIREPHFNPHMQPLVTWVEGGIVSLVGSLILILFVTRGLLLASQRSQSVLSPYVRGGLVAWFVFLAGMIVTFPLDFQFFWIMLGMWLGTSTLVLRSVKPVYFAESH